MLKKEKTRTKKLYSIGYSPTLNQYILATFMLGLVRYKRYFRITQQEYTASPEKLDKLAWDCRTKGLASWRYLCSEKHEENSEAQNNTYRRLSEGMVCFQHSRAKYF